MKHLSLIQAIVLLDSRERLKGRSHSKKSDVHQFEITNDNIDSAYKLAHKILGRTLRNLSPPSRLLLLLIKQMVDKACASQQINRNGFCFTFEDVRKYTGWRRSKLKLHLQRLNQKRHIYQEGKVYRLLYSGEGGRVEHFLMGPVFNGLLPR